MGLFLKMEVFHTIIEILQFLLPKDQLFDYKIYYLNLLF